MARDYNYEIVDLIRNHLEEDGWHYSFDEKEGAFKFGVSLHGRIKNVRYFIMVNKTDYNVYAVSPISADCKDPQEMKKMAEFVCRANFGLRNGNFELDFSDGELRYKCFVDCNGSMPTTEMIGTSISIPAGMFDRYGKGIFQVLVPDMTAEDAIELCEGSKRRTVLESHKKEDDENEDDSVDTSHLMDLLKSLRSNEDDDDEAKSTGE